MTSIPDNHVRDRSRVQLRNATQDSLNRAPLALNGSSCETEHEIRPSRIGWMIWPALVLGFVVVAAVASI